MSSVAGVYEVRDFVPQLNYASENAAKALRGMLDLGLDVHDYNIQKKQSNLMNQSQKIKEQIKADQEQLEKLKAKLAQLGG